MKILVILSCLGAAAFALPAQDLVADYQSNGGIRCRLNCRGSRPNLLPSNDCPTVPCPPPDRDGFCGIPNCGISGNRYALHPHIDPNFFYQCSPVDAIGNFDAQVRLCACGTLFSLNVDPPRCVHPWEWSPSCSGQTNFPVLRDESCPRECPTCGGGGDSVTAPPPTVNPTPPPTVAPPVDPPNGCECPCNPCVMWPCMPCMQSCACNNPPQQQQPPQRPSIPSRPWIPAPPAVQPPINQIPSHPWIPAPPAVQPPSNQIPSHPWIPAPPAVQPPINQIPSHPWIPAPPQEQQPPNNQIPEWPSNWNNGWNNPWNSNPWMSFPQQQFPMPLPWMPYYDPMWMPWYTYTE